MSGRRRILGVTAYIVFLLVFVEMALQGFYYFTAGAPLWARVGRPIYAPNEHSGIWNKPSLSMEHNTSEFRTMVYTNAAGFRTSAQHEEYPLAKDPSRLRLMLLGPSFAFGWAVNFEETFLVQLGGLLKESGIVGPRDIEPINAGVPSLDVVSHLRWYAARGREYQPDLVIQFIYGSMARGKRTYQDAVNADGYLVRADARTADKMRGYAKQSAIVFYGWVLATRVRELVSDEGASDGVIEGAGRELVERESFDPADEDLRASLEFYQDLRKTVTDGGGQLLVAYFPLSYGIYPEDVARWQHLGVKNIESQRQFDEDFCNYLNGQSVPCLNLTADLMAAAASNADRLYYWLDIHWTPRGHRVTAETVARYLQAHRELLGPPGPMIAN